MPLKDIKVTNFSISGKPVCDFLCVNNNNLPHTLSVSEIQVCWIIGDIFGVNRKLPGLNSGPQNSVPRNYRNRSIVRWKKYSDILNV